MARHAPGGRWPLLLLTATWLAACGGSDDEGPAPVAPSYQAELRRTAMGIAHIKAEDWRGLGYGLGYAQAQDNLCTLADAFLTYRGERSRHLGGQALAVNNSTIGRPRNIDSDFFHRHLLPDDAVQTMAAAQSADMHALVDGFATGYNRYVREIQAGDHRSAHAACRAQPWVQAITAQDLWRRMMQAGLAAGHSNFVAAIANAQPPVAGGDKAAPADWPKPDEVHAPQLEVGGSAGVGSNMYGFGSAVTGGDGPLLFGNPHWYWKGADRFYQAQLTIPGRINVSGVSFLGVPLVLIGFNEHVAWSHTVSTARRFGLFQLSLAEGSPTTYLVDGQPVPMQATPISVQVRNDDGSLSTVTRTLYKSRHGPLVNLGALHPALGWGSASAFAMRDINSDNHRIFRNWLRWGQATSLEAFIAIQKQESAVPWVNTVAVGRGSDQAWYADIGAVPNVPDALLAQCATPAGQALAAALPGVPVLNGARSACNWQSDADSAQPGALGPARMPSLLRSDYVANMNDSYWLANPAAPLSGYPAIFGPAGSSAQTLRTRLGHIMVQERLAGIDGQAGRQASSAIVRDMVLNSRVLSAELFKEQALALVCTEASIEGLDVRAACAALQAWDNHGHADSRGSHLWDEFWGRVQVPVAQLFAVPFDPQDPLHTPRGLQASAAPALRTAFAAAVQAVAASGAAMDAPRGQLLYATRDGQRIALYGGCGGLGYFTIACSELPLGQGGYAMDGQPHGNTYMQVVSFGSGGVQAHSFLTFSQSDDPASPHYGDYTRAYAAKQWHRVPFTESEITGHSSYRTQTLSQ
ncbi:penicillin acylase family protein [Vandammella animalimorsus]|uniref:Penicillin acylase family protein n=1 Tax=Vandammella animalimorsus TaxID=2029117 RepID=A0A3M6R1P9_9BURK|nr:penicillin acylase family protein [Vandammella animalimorsus]RMX09204.1 penicillin acylase family protein [Vandammella animalimorsus]